VEVDHELLLPLLLAQRPGPDLDRSIYLLDLNHHDLLL
jgi:hypothetical protein